MDGATRPLSPVSFGQPYERDGVTVITAARSMTRSTTTSETADPGGAGPAGERPIVVGIDGSAGSTAALRWAAAEVWRHGRPLTVICVVAPPAYSGYPTAPVPALDEALMASGEAYLEEALAAVFGDNRPARGPS